MPNKAPDGEAKIVRTEKALVEAKKAQIEKADKSNYRTFIRHKYKKADEILSDFSEGIIIRFFYRRKSPLPYNCTAT